MRCCTFRCGECLTSGLCPNCFEGGSIARAPQGEETVGFGRRAGARILDMVAGQFCAIVSGVGAGIVLLVLERMGLARSGWLERIDHGLGFSMAVGALASVSGAAISGTLGGSSAGKLVLGLRVVRMDGQRAGFGANLIRELGYFVDALFFGLIGKAAMDASPHHQRHGDSWANTAVVLATKTPVWPMPRVLLGLALGIGVHIAVLMTAFVLAAL